MASDTKKKFPNIDMKCGEMWRSPGAISTLTVYLVEIAIASEDRHIISNFQKRITVLLVSSISTTSGPFEGDSRPK